MPGQGSSSQVIDVQPFRTHRLPESGFILFLGKRGTGKSTLAMYMSRFWKHKTAGMAVCMCGSESVKNDWAPVVPKLFTVDCSTEYIDNLLRNQNDLVRKYEQRKEPFPAHHEKLIILDDVASSKAFMRSKAFLYLSSNSRHLHLTTFVLAQYLFQVPAECRNQFDLVFAMSTNNKKNITTLHSEYANSVPIRIFRSVLTTVTENYGVLCIDNRKNVSAITEVCSYTRTPHPLAPERIGSPALWEYSEKHYLDLDRLREHREYRETRRRAGGADDFFVDDDDAEEDKDNGTEEDLFNTTYDILDNRRSFFDRDGSILVRKVPLMPKTTKID